MDRWHGDLGLLRYTSANTFCITLSYAILVSTYTRYHTTQSYDFHIHGPDTTLCPAPFIVFAHSSMGVTDISIHPYSTKQLTKYLRPYTTIDICNQFVMQYS